MVHGNRRARSAHVHRVAGAAPLRRLHREPWSDRFGPAVEWEDFIDCGDWVVAPWSATLHGHGSGIEIEVSETYAVLVRDGLITHVDEDRTVRAGPGGRRPARRMKKKRPRRERSRFEGGVMRMCSCEEVSDGARAVTRHRGHDEGGRARRRRTGPSPRAHRRGRRSRRHDQPEREAAVLDRLRGQGEAPAAPGSVPARPSAIVSAPTRTPGTIGAASRPRRNGTAISALPARTRRPREARG